MMRRLLPVIGTFLLLTAALFAADRAYLALKAPEPRVATALKAVDPASAPAPSVPALALPIKRPASFYEPVTARPLFAPTRRPDVTVAAPTPMDPEPDGTDDAAILNEPAAEATPAAEPVIEADLEEDAPPELRLHGVMIGPFASRALVSRQGTELEWLQLDMELDGWRISSIFSDWIEITRDARKVRVDMHDTR